MQLSHTHMHLTIANVVHLTATFLVSVVFSRATALKDREITEAVQLENINSTKDGGTLPCTTLVMSSFAEVQTHTKRNPRRTQEYRCENL